MSDDEYPNMNVLYSTVDVDLGNTSRFQGEIGHVYLQGTAQKAIGSAVNDRIRGNDQDNFINGGDGNDSMGGLNGDDTVLGGSGNDTITGGEGADTLNGGADDDSLSGDAGADILIGGTGSDTATYHGSRGLIASLANPEKNAGHAKGDTYVSIENLHGSRSMDILEGDGRANILEGEGGRDTLTGGSGADAFRFGWRYDYSYDIITDFVAGMDRIELASWAHSAISEGTLASAAFTSNTSGTASTADHRLIYETDTGRVRYDADGSGSGASILFAVLTPNLSITHEDFFVY